MPDKKQARSATGGRKPKETFIGERLLPPEARAAIKDKPAQCQRREHANARTGWQSRLRKRHPSLPPSINRAPGLSDLEIEGQRGLRSLEPVVRSLPLKEGVEEREIATAARWLLMADWETAGLRLGRKSGLNKKGRPPKKRADYVATTAALIYEEHTGARAYRSIDRDFGKPYGDFHKFLTKVFEVLGIKDSSPDAANQRLQAKLKAIERGKS
jgi:hypothetical protein